MLCILNNFPSSPLFLYQIFPFALFLKDVFEVWACLCSRVSMWTSVCRERDSGEEGVGLWLRGGSLPCYLRDDHVARTSGVRFSLSVQFPPLPTRSPQHLPFKVLRWLYFPQTLLPFSVNPGMFVWLATSYINPNFSFPTAFSKSVQLVSIFSLYCKAIFHTFLNQILREYSDHPVSHQEFFLLRFTFLIFSVRW